MKDTRVAVIVNPAAGNGRMRRAWPGIEARLRQRFGRFALYRTTGREDAAIFAQKAAAGGAGLIIAVGGNGTFNEIANGLLKAGKTGSGAPELGFVPVGVGMDLARSLGLPLDMAGAIAALERPAKPVDAGRLTCVDEKGGRAERHFVNIASLGVSGPIVRAVNQAKGKGFLSGQLLFFVRTVRELIRYRFSTVRVTVEGHAPWEMPLAVAAIANGRFFGSGMAVAPDAQVDDGHFDVVMLQGTSKFFLIDQFSKIYNGAHRDMPQVTILRGSNVHVEAASDSFGPTLVEADGDICGFLPARLDMLPGVLKIRC